MPSASGHYDQALLAEAQTPTRAQLQEGYNADILRPNRAPGRNDTDPESIRSHSTPASKEHLPAPVTHSTKPPFYRTRKGIIIIAVAVLIVIGAVVGGAVGGTVGKNDNNDAATVSGSMSLASTATDVGPTVSGNTEQPIASGTQDAASSTDQQPPPQTTDAQGGSVSSDPF